MSNTSTFNKFPKITNFTRRTRKNPEPNTSVKQPISPMSLTTSEHESKSLNTMDHSGHDKTLTDKITNAETPSPVEQDPSTNIVENNKVLQQALGPLVTKFKLLRESVNTVHTDYKDLKHVISKQKEEIKHELIDKIDKNTTKLVEIRHENRILCKENESLKSRLDRI